MSEMTEVEVDEVRAIGAEVLCEFERVSALPARETPEEGFLIVTRLLGIAALKALPGPTERQLSLLRQALSEI